MSVIKVLNTQTVSGSESGFVVAKTGIFRIHSNGQSSVSFNDGPAIHIHNQQELPFFLQGGKPGRAAIVAATDSATCVYTLGDGGVGLTGDTHPFRVGDYIAVTDAAGVIPSAFESAAGSGKKITAITGNTITTDIDSSAASGNYTYTGGNQASVVRCIKITSGSNNLVVEEIQIVGG